MFINSWVILYYVFIKSVLSSYKLIFFSTINYFADKLSENVGVSKFKWVFFGFLNFMYWGGKVHDDGCEGWGVNNINPSKFIIFKNGPCVINISLNIKPNLVLLYNF